MEQNRIQEINDISDIDDVDTTEMDADARRVYFLSTIVSALLATITAWTLFFMFTDLDDLRLLLKCGIASIVIPVVFNSIYKMREKNNDYLKIVPCMKYTNLLNWTMTAAPLFLIIYDIIRFALSIGLPGGFYSYLAIFVFCFVICLFLAINASQAYDEEEPFYSLIVTYVHDNTILWWISFFGFAAVGCILVIRGGLF